jgi:drug/metabolite transporter (DMT)-like permease
MTEKGIRRARIVPAIPESIGWGVGLAVVAACVSGLAIWLNAFAVKQVPDAAVYTTLKNGVAAVVLLVVAAPLVRGSDVRQVGRTGWVGLTIVGIVGGGIAFLLFFTGLAMASAPSAAFIQKTMFVWVAILAVPLLSERLGFVQIAALAALAVGQALVLPPRGVAWGMGETMILIATLLWAVEVVIVRRVLRAVPTSIVATGRLGIGLVVLVGYILFTGRIGGLLALAPQAWAWILLTGLILAGYVAAWFAALRRAPATIVTSVLVGGAVITGALQSLARGGPPTVDLVGGYVLIAAAVGVTALLALRTRPLAGQSSNATRVGTIDA